MEVAGAWFRSQRACNAALRGQACCEHAIVGLPAGGEECSGGRAYAPTGTTGSARVQTPRVRARDYKAECCGSASAVKSWSKAAASSAKRLSRR
jgi:hypothetical protein